MQFLLGSQYYSHHVGVVRVFFWLIGIYLLGRLMTVVDFVHFYKTRKMTEWNTLLFLSK